MGLSQQEMPVMTRNLLMRQRDREANTVNRLIYQSVTSSVFD